VDVAPSSLAAIVPRLAAAHAPKCGGIKKALGDIGAGLLDGVATLAHQVFYRRWASPDFLGHGSSR
jgi:hypothetical protein